MRWKKVDDSGDVIDARGSSLSGGGTSMGGFPIPIGKAGGGLGLIIALVVIALQVAGGGQSFDVNQAFPSGQTVSADNAEGIPADQDPDKDFKDFSSYVFVTAQQG